jgi:glycine cleavage system H protein
MSTVPSDRKYLVSHEWHRTSGDLVEIGITQFAADELTDVTYVKLPKVGASLEKDKTFGEIESVKATSDLYSGVSGTVVEVNPALDGDPGLVNRDPYASAWMIRVRPSGASSLSEKLLEVNEYLKLTGH